MERKPINQFPTTIDDELRQAVIAEYDQIRGHVDEVELQELIDDLLDFAESLRMSIFEKTTFLAEDNLTDLMARPDREISKQDIIELRQQGYLIAIKDHGVWLYPDFQFDPVSGSPYEGVHAVIERLDGAFGPWGHMAWWVNIHPVLGTSPAKALGKRDAALLRAVDFTLD